MATNAFFMSAQTAQSPSQRTTPRRKQPNMMEISPQASSSPGSPYRMRCTPSPKRMLMHPHSSALPAGHFPSSFTITTSNVLAGCSNTSNILASVKNIECNSASFSCVSDSADKENALPSKSFAEASQRGPASFMDHHALSQPPADLPKAQQEASKTDVGAAARALFAERRGPSNPMKATHWNLRSYSDNNMNENFLFNKNAKQQGRPPFKKSFTFQGMERPSGSDSGSDCDDEDPVSPSSPKRCSLPNIALPSQNPAPLPTRLFKPAESIMSRPNKIRRTHSMHPANSMEEDDYCDEFSKDDDIRLPEIDMGGWKPWSGVNNGETCTLPCEQGKDSIRRITAQTLVDLVSGNYRDKMDEFHIVDCRFPYEYEGGHIVGARNISAATELDKLLLKNPPTDSKRSIIVFHCEFSSHRAPRMALYLRQQDRTMNAARYPFLYYPEIYILRGGYKAFFAEFKTFCFPQSYIEMNHDLYRDECRRELTNLKRNWGRSKSLSDCGNSSIFDSVTSPTPKLSARPKKIQEEDDDGWLHNMTCPTNREKLF